MSKEILWRYWMMLVNKAFERNFLFKTPLKAATVFKRGLLVYGV
jgi:hypothetical protein